VHVVTDDGRKFLAYYERDRVVTRVSAAACPAR
jgi:hypothetical protein